MSALLKTGRAATQLLNRLLLLLPSQGLFLSCILEFKCKRRECCLYRIAFFFLIFSYFLFCGSYISMLFDGSKVHLMFKWVFCIVLSSYNESQLQSSVA
jgi:hypothetical protein